MRQPDEREGGPSPEPPSETPPPTKRETASIVTQTDVVAAEAIALARHGPWDLPACACCTRDEDRRSALGRLHDQDQRARIATAFHALAPLDLYYRTRGRVA